MLFRLEFHKAVCFARPSGKRKHDTKLGKWQRSDSMSLFICSSAAISSSSSSSSTARVSRFLFYFRFSQRNCIYFFLTLSLCVPLCAPPTTFPMTLNAPSHWLCPVLTPAKSKNKVPHATFKHVLTYYGANGTCTNFIQFAHNSIFIFTETNVH